MAAVVTETEGFLADAPALPGWESVARGIGSPGCVFHFRRVTGAFASKEYRFEYSRRAMKGPKGWRPLVYNVPVVVTRPTADGGTETLPERLAIRAVCLMPRTDRGTVEAIGSVEAILKAMGILSAKKGMADAGHAVPKGEGPSAVLAALGWVRERLSVRPLSAAQEGCSASTGAETGECAIETDDIVVTGTPSPIPISCPAGFDYEGTTNSCRISVNLGGGGANPGDTNTGGSGGGNGDGGDGEEGGPRTVDFTLTCSDSVPRGSGGSCGVSAPDSAGVSMGALDIAWSSTTGATDSGLGLSAWSGTATETVTVTVAITDPAGAIAGFSDDETVTVTSRGWTWGDSVVNANFTFSSLDSCFPAGALAATIPANCAADWVQSSYTPGAGDGPWTGVDYVADASAAIDVEWAYNREFRSDGPHYAMSGDTALLNSCPNTLATMNVHAANTTCSAASDFSQLMAFAAGHEAKHIAAIEAEAGRHDLLADWEPVAGSASHVRAEVGRIAKAIEGAIRRASDWKHTPGLTYRVWLWDGKNGWRRLPITVEN